MHNTSRVEDEPYPNLLREMGFGGFPSLAFLDAKGEKLGSPPGRDVGIFESTLSALVTVQELGAKKKRTAAEEAALFVARLDLGELSLDDAKAGRESLKGLTDAQKAHVDNELILLEVTEVTRRAGRDRNAAYAEFAKMAKAGRTPSGSRSLMFWFGTMTHAMNAKDAELLESALAKAEAEFGGQQQYERYLQQFRDALAGMKKDG